LQFLDENLGPKCRTLISTTLLPRTREHLAMLDRLMGSPVRNCGRERMRGLSRRLLSHVQWHWNCETL
jgi:hypothetical protein